MSVLLSETVAHHSVLPLCHGFRIGYSAKRITEFQVNDKNGSTIIGLLKRNPGSPTGIYIALIL